jgi:hypothetical protein
MVCPGAASMKALGMFLALLAWGMAGFAAYTAVLWARARSWPAVPCVITASLVDEHRGRKPYHFRVAYRYERSGRWHDGRVYREDYKGSEDVAEADRLARAYPVGARRVCLVNPGAPSEAVLRHDNVWLPVALVAGMGLGGAFLLGVFVAPGYRMEACSGPFLFLMGLACYVVLFGTPLWAGLRSRGWRATSCVIASGEVRSETHHGLLTVTSYWPNVVYRYEVGGVVFRANTWNASDVGSPWYYGARGVVRRYPPGARAACFVNPADPSEAVLDRSLSGSQWFGVWPLVMAGLGAVGVVKTVTGREPRLGTPRLWGTLALWAATTSALTVLWATGSDLVRDVRVGIAEPFEYVAVALTSIVSSGLLLVWIALAVDHRAKPVQAGKRGAGLLAVWDRQIDTWGGRK